MVQHPIPPNSGIENQNESIDQLLNYVITFLKSGLLAPASANTKME
jgi:hypothetical protein